MTDEERAIEVMARENGDDYDALPGSKSEWTAKRGEFGGRYRDINEPRKSDYDDLARAAYAALRAHDAETLKSVVMDSEGNVVRDET